MPYEYNALLKDGLQKVSNGGGDVDERIAALQNAINELQTRLNDLKNSKITKIASTSQLSELSDGEIFEWQGVTTSDYQNGYFYKKNGNNYTRVDLQPNYTLPIANANNLGGVKVGSGLNVDETGLLSVTGGDSLKVPRCFTQAQINALTDNDIFEWQGETTADYTQGYFYKKTSNTTVLIESGATYLNNTFGPYIRGNYSVQNGYYKFIEETNDIDNGYFINKNSDSTRFYCSLMPAVVGQVAIVTTEAHVGGNFIEFVTVTAVNSYGYPTEYSDGVSVSFSSNPDYKNSKICKYQNVKTNDIVYFPVYPNGGYPFAFFALILDNGVYYPIGRLTANVYVATTDITETTIITAQKDTQPQPTNGSGLIVNFTPDTSAVRDNIQSGDTLSIMAVKLNNILTSNIYIHISSGSINDYLDNGNYFTWGGSEGSSDAKRISDKPTNITGGFLLQVNKYDTYVYQRFIHYSGIEFSRMIFTDSNPTVFGEWKTLTNLS